MQVKILDRYRAVPELFSTHYHYVRTDSLTDCAVEIWPEWVAAVPESGTTPTVFVNAEPNQNMALELFETRQQARPNSIWLVSSERSDLAWPFQHWRWMPWWQILVHRVNGMLPQPQEPACKKWRAHCLLGGYSPKRQRMLEILHGAGVLDLCLYNLWPREPGYPAHGRPWTRPDVAMLDDSRFRAAYQEGCINTMQPIDFDQSQGYLSCIIPQRLYDHCEIGLIAETGDGLGINCTEKISKCLVYGQPFVVFGGAGTLQRLRQMGYRTFHPWINEDYDLISDSDERLEAVCRSMITYCESSDQQRSEILKNTKAAAYHNARRARNWGFLLDPLTHAIDYLL